MNWRLKSETDLSTRFQRFARRQIPRVLTHMDRDPDSPTFGSFDRDHWHYKIRDFESALLQQGAFTLEALRKGCVVGEQPSAQFGSWAVAAVNALARQVRRNGSLDEYYPFEESYPSAAFGLWVSARLLYEWQSDAPDLAAQVHVAPLARLARHLGKQHESQAMNQQAAALAGLVLAVKAQVVSASDVQLERHVDRLFASQNSEGWFPEYGGPDLGYLSVTLDALMDYHDATQDERATVIAGRAIQFMAQLVGADGRLPSTLNSRNTDYAVPYGLVRFGARNTTAAWLAQTLFRNIDQPTHFAYATDDRYSCHYIFASIVRSLSHLGNMAQPEPPILRTQVWFPNCGFWVRHASDEQWSVFVGAKKGGVVRVHRADGTVAVDYGLRVKLGRKVWSTNWWDTEQTPVVVADSEVRVKRAATLGVFHVPGPVVNTGLRILAFMMGRGLIPYLKKFLIFRGKRTNDPEFERTIRLEGKYVHIADKIQCDPSAKIFRAPRQHLRHVASAESFSREDVMLAEENALCLDGREFTKSVPLTLTTEQASDPD